MKIENQTFENISLINQTLSLYQFLSSIVFAEEQTSPAWNYDMGSNYHEIESIRESAKFGLFS